MSSTPEVELVICADCGKTEQAHLTGRTTEEGIEKHICFTCCAKRDKQSMIDTGKFVGYLSRIPDSLGSVKFKVTNWPSSLYFECFYFKVTVIRGIERIRTTVKFVGPDGFSWFGVHRGYNNEIIRCRRTKVKAK